MRTSDFSSGIFVILILIEMSRLFDHEKLEVYQASLALIVWLEPVLQRLPKSDQNSDYD